MKQLGNLAIVCAKRPEVLMQIYGGEVAVHVGTGPDRATLLAAWDRVGRQGRQGARGRCVTSESWFLFRSSRDRRLQRFRC